MTVATLLLFMSLATAPALEVADPAATWVNANQRYEDGEYAVAAGLYQSLVNAGIETGDLFYNLGNARLRAGELGAAIAAYRRAASHLPRDQDLLANLEFARRSRLDAITPPESPPALRTAFFWHFNLSRTERLRGAIVLHLLFWLVMSLRLFWRRSEVLRWSLAATLLLLAAVGGSWLLHTVRPARVAVVTAPEVSVHSGHRVDEVVRFQLHAGTEVRVLDRREGWLRITLPDGQQGWLDGAYAELVE